MTLTDTGPLIALFEPREEKHQICLEIFRKISDELITTIPCLTEAMYFLGDLKNWHGQEKLWNLIETEALGVYQLTQTDLSRMKILMEKYQDIPMDFADASLVVAAESLNTKKIFSFDRDFYIYRIKDAESFEIVS